MHFKTLVLTLLTIAGSLAAAPADEPSTKLDEIADLFASSLNRNFVVPAACKPATTARSGRYSCAVPSAPLYMNWREFQASTAELRKEFAGRLSVLSWRADDHVSALKEVSTADYWTIEYGDTCLVKAPKPSGKLCLVVKVINAWE